MIRESAMKSYPCGLLTIYTVPRHLHLEQDAGEERVDQDRQIDSEASFTVMPNSV
jgi:hypothetical protein